MVGEGVQFGQGAGQIAQLLVVPGQKEVGVPGIRLRRGGDGPAQGVDAQLVGPGVEVDDAALVLIDGHARLHQGHQRGVALGGAGVVGDGRQEAGLGGRRVARLLLGQPGQIGHLPLGSLGTGHVADGVVLGDGPGRVAARQQQPGQPPAILHDDEALRRARGRRFQRGDDRVGVAQRQVGVGDARLDVGGHVGVGLGIGAEGVDGRGVVAQRRPRPAQIESRRVGNIDRRNQGVACRGSRGVRLLQERLQRLGRGGILTVVEQGNGVAQPRLGRGARAQPTGVRGGTEGSGGRRVVAFGRGPLAQRQQFRRGGVGRQGDGGQGGGGLAPGGQLQRFAGEGGRPVRAGGRGGLVRRFGRRAQRRGRGQDDRRRRAQRIALDRGSLVVARRGQGRRRLQRRCGFDRHGALGHRRYPAGRAATGGQPQPDDHHEQQRR